MNKKDVNIVKEEETEKNAALASKTVEKKLTETEEQDVFTTVIQKQVSKAIEKAVLEKMDKPQRVVLDGTPEVKVEFPEYQKIVGIKKLNSNIVALGEIIVKMWSKVSEIKKITGNVTAKVEFPKVQVIKGKVDAVVEFPKMQKIEGLVDAGIPFVQLGKVKAIPVAYWNGKGFVDPGSSQQSVQGNGRTENSLRAITAYNRETYTPTSYSGVTNALITVKAFAGKFGGYYYDNPNATKMYIQVFLDQDAVVLGTTAPDAIFGIPANGAANIEIARGVGFKKRLQIAATTQPNGNAAPTTPLPITLYFNQP